MERYVKLSFFSRCFYNKVVCYNLKWDRKASCKLDRILYGHREDWTQFVNVMQCQWCKILQTFRKLSFVHKSYICRSQTRREPVLIQCSPAFKLKKPYHTASHAILSRAMAYSFVYSSFRWLCLFSLFLFLPHRHSNPRHNLEETKCYCVQLQLTWKYNKYPVEHLVEYLVEQFIVWQASWTCSFDN
jgi:hypothetical protein